MALCDLCEAGQFQDLPVGYNCSESPAGYTANDDRTNIVKCAAGTYADVAGLPKCKECQPGTTQHLQGARLHSMREGSLVCRDGRH